MSAEVLSAFSADYAAKITGLTARQLGYWDHIGLFKPSVIVAKDAARPVKIYLFNDVVGLRVIAVLRSEHHISVQQLRRAAEKLYEYSKTPWSELRIVVCKGEVSFIDPATGHASGVFSGQGVLVPIIDHIDHVRKAASDLNKRLGDQVGTVVRNRNVVHNLQVFAGTRIPVWTIKGFLAAGYSVNDILEEYPSLQREDVEAVQREKDKPAAA